jgi:hypothetical protein
MDAETVTVTIKGVKHFFTGDELTSPEQQAILFLQQLSEEKGVF